MNDDLISRSALKEKLTDVFETVEVLLFDDIIDMLDEAPAVDLKPFANVIFDKDELRRLVDEKVVKAIKSGELVVKTEGEWTPVLERLPEGKIDPITKDFEPVLCSTIWDDVRVYKFGKPIGHDKAHFWSGGGIMDKYVIAWKPMPEPYKEEKI